MSQTAQPSSAISPSTGLVSISPYPGSTVEYRPGKLSKLNQDFGGIRNMVAGWEQQMNNNNNMVNRVSGSLLTPTSTYQGNTSPTNSHPPTPLTPSSSSSSIVSSTTANPASSTAIAATAKATIVVSPNLASAGVKTARDAFFSDPFSSSGPNRPTSLVNQSTANSQQRLQLTNQPTLLNNSSNHLSPRFASVDRLAGREKIYDQSSSEMKSPSPEPNVAVVVVDDDDTINSKKDLYMTRDIPHNSISSSSNDPVLLNSSSSHRNAYSGNNKSSDNLVYTRSRDRDNLDSTVTSSSNQYNNNSKDKSMASKDTEINVGFSDLPNQIHRKTIKKGFEFTLMVVGESELGKSTLVNSLFLTDIYSSEYPGPSKRPVKTVDVQATKVNLKEKNVNLSLTIVDTPGFGDSLNNTESWQKIGDYIENRYEEYLNAETKLHRTHIHDTRVHCCLYFILPRVTLRAIDIELMKNLQDKVNIIPIIAKADSLTPEECQQMKLNVMNQINLHQIKIYQFPECDDEEDAKLLKQLKDRIPFAVCGSNYIIETPTGERRRARKYPWGTVEIDNLDHCDFSALRMMLIKYYMLDLVDKTNDIHYENYRCRKLSGIGTDKAFSSENNDVNPLAQMEGERKSSEAKLKILEQEMDHVFETKVKAKEEKLTEMEAEILRFDEQNRKVHEKELQELADKRGAFEREREAFELVVRDMEEMRKNTLEVAAKEHQSASRTLNFRKLFTGKHGKKFSPDKHSAYNTQLSLDSPNGKANSPQPSTKSLNYKHRCATLDY